jgi:very-short-patch-repair endonuclease
VSRPAVPAVARVQHGAFTREQAHAVGWSNRSLASAVRTGLLVRRHGDVYVLPGPRTALCEDAAARLAGGPAAVLSGWSAARWQGWAWPVGLPRPACITLPRDQHLRLQGVLVMRRHLPEQHVLRREDGLSVTLPARTVVDCLRLAPPPVREGMLDTALLRRWTTVDDVTGVVDALGNGPGTASLRRLLSGVDEGARSHAERLAMQVLRRTGLRGWRWNYAVTLPDGGTAVVDAALPHHRIAVEIDGRAFHVDSATFQRDRTRQNSLVALGWTVLRFTWWDLRNRPDYVVATVLAAVARAS